MKQKDSTDAKLLATLKRHNPHTVMAFNGDTDDEGRKIAVPTRRRKWATVIASIEARPWSRVECLDKAGAVLGYIDNDAGGGDLEDLTDASPGTTAKSTPVQIGMAIAAMCQKAADSALKARENEVRAILEANAVVMREQTAAMSGLVQALQLTADAREDAANAHADAIAVQAQAAAAGGGGFKELLDALPTLLQLAAMAKQTLGAGAATPPPKNGAH